MPSYASGAAYIDGSGAVLAADPGFLVALGLPPQDPTAALRARAEELPALRALLGGEGPDVVLLGAGEDAVELARHPAAGGALLLARSARLQEQLEHGLRSGALSRLASGVAHDIKNPLNAMALQLAILTEKLTGQDGAVAAAVGTHLAALREQVGRVNEVVRRLMDVIDPSAPLGYLDPGALLVDVGALLAHEARRRRVELVIGPARGGPRAGGDPARVGRLCLVLLAGAMAATPDGGRLEASVEAQDGQAVLRVAHAVDGSARDPGYDWEVGAAAASALGGELLVEREADVRRLALRLPRIERT